MHYISSAEILYIHSRLVTEIGGAAGLRDLSVLKKATRYIHDTEAFPTVLEKAGALFFALTRKQPFMSCNMPTAFAVTGIFLRVNQYDLQMSHDLIRSLLESGKKHTVAEYAAILSGHVKLLAG